MSVQRLAIPDLGRIFAGETVTGLSEWQLLERYLERRDESAFEALVTRHGPMVLGVCRRMLGGSPEAEDAFQATFLILIRRARDLGPRDAIGPWLYGVATRVAARTRAQAARRQQQSAPLAFAIPDRSGSTIDPDLVEVLDLELSRLPGKYRSPLVLCYLEGRTHEEAARDLNWPVGTVKGRLARARELLRSRLSRRGFAPPAGVLGVLSGPELITILDRPLAERIAGASARLAAGQSTAQVVSRSVTTLVEGVLTAMSLTKIKWAALATVATGFALTSAAVLGRQEPQPKPVAPGVSTKAVPADGKVGSAKQKQADVRPEMKKERGTPEVYAKKEERAPGRAPQKGSARRVDRREAEVGEREDGRANDVRSRQILEKLDEPISMSFNAETPLDDVLKYIRQATTTKTFSGIPIYVDPIGLNEAERSLNSTIQINLEGVPLRRTLQLLLTQLGLAYFVEDGMLVITSEDSAKKPLPSPMAGPTPLDRMVEKAERGEMSVKELKELLEVIKLIQQVRHLHEATEKKADIQ
jgi:RNA polymerase sigma factor (sigma-70 family)